MNNIFPKTTDWIKNASKYIISQIEKEKERLTFDPIRYPDEVTAIFMAWAPGCGKTEFIHTVLNYFEFFFIDIDSYRDLFDGYTWKNASEYQSAISGVINNVMKYCLENNIRFILDGTFKSGMHSLGNMRECKKYKRKVEIYFIFQNPYKSYFFTYLREIREERSIDINQFIDCFYNSIRNIYRAYEKYKTFVSLYIIEKDIGIIPFTHKPFHSIEFDKVANIEFFCKRYNIRYNSGTEEFPNQESFRNQLDSDKRLFLEPLRPIIKLLFRLKWKVWRKKRETS
jgi:UDP-N-acetylglucosamine kinase